jgi:hypothetical protein
MAFWFAKGISWKPFLVSFGATAERACEVPDFTQKQIGYLWYASQKCIYTVCIFVGMVMLSLP